MNCGQLFDKLYKIDENNFAVVEEKCIEVYSKEDFYATPIPKDCTVISMENMELFKETLHDMVEIGGKLNQSETAKFILNLFTEYFN